MNLVRGNKTKIRRNARGIRIEVLQQTLSTIKYTFIKSIFSVDLEFFIRATYLIETNDTNIAI